jgi:hypothetical protein
MNKVWLRKCMSMLSLAGWLAACTTPVVAPTAGALADTDVSGAIDPTPTSPVALTAPETNTPIPSFTQTGTATASATARATLTPRPTETATPPPTRTRAPLPTATATVTPSPRPEAPRFPETSLSPFDPNSLRRELQELVDFQANFLSYFRRVAAGEEGNCRTFYRYRNELIVSQEAYFDVPNAWYDLYYRYRVLVHAAVNNVQPITAVCDAGGGDVPPETDQAIIANLETHIAQAQQLVIEAATLP